MQIVFIIFLLLSITTNIFAGKKKKKVRLPKKYSNLTLTEEQETKLKTEYKKIFTPEIIKQLRAMRKEIKLATDDSVKIEKRKELRKIQQPLNKKFNKIAATILTEEQLQELNKKKRQKKRNRNKNNK